MNERRKMKDERKVLHLRCPIVGSERHCARPIESLSTQNPLQATDMINPDYNLMAINHVELSDFFFNGAYCDFVVL